MRKRGLDDRLIALLDQAEALRDTRLIAAFPEHQVQLPGGARPSQTDVWAILRATGGLVSLAVEGKAGETFGETVADWRASHSDGKERRLQFLRDAIGQTGPLDDTLRYQLFHRTASAVIEADRLGAEAAVMIVLSFAPDDRSKADFVAFASSIGVEGAPGRLARTTLKSGRQLFLGWLDVECCNDAQIAAIPSE